MRQLASIRTISDIQPIPNADAIEVATVDGWEVVIKKGEYSVGDQALYLEIDSWVPKDIAPFLFKGRSHKGIEGERLRTVKLRGQISQGLLLPLEVIPEDADMENLAESLGIIKWERELHKSLAGMAKGNFPSFLKKTDQERVQNVKKYLPDWQDDVWEVTMKLDGSSMTVYHNDGVSGVCSRNLDLKLEQEGNAFVDFVKSGLLDAWESYCSESGRNLAVQGELMGGKIQGNREEFHDYKFFVFDVWDIDGQRYLNHWERRSVLNGVGDIDHVDHAPVLTVDTLQKLELTDVQSILAYAEGKSINHPVREGVVFKNMKGESFKAISQKFLLKGGD